MGKIAGKDLGTYHLRVELMDGSGWIQEWSTGYRYSRGADGIHPLNGEPIHPPYVDEYALFACMAYMYMEGNYSCDCNKADFLAQSLNKDSLDVNCGDAMKIKRLIAIRPDLSEKIIVEIE